MTWIPVPVNPKDVTADFLFNIAKKHRLIRASTVDDIVHFKEICSRCAVILIEDDETKEEIGHVIFSNIQDGESADLDLIPNPKYFSPAHPEFREEIKVALVPVLESLMEGRSLRRVNASVPESRNRTKKALMACGFEKEGVTRKGIKFAGKEAENIINMGLLSGKE